MHSTQDSFGGVTQQLTPRQDRIERAIIDALRSRATRSELREQVRDLAQLLRMQGHAPERASALVSDLGQRAAPLMPTDESAAVGDAPTDRINMMLRWCAAEFTRSD
jgi:predicted ArsR family transcriptional regulator